MESVAYAVHVVRGTAGLASGAGAMVARKGSRALDRSSEPFPPAPYLVFGAIAVLAAIGDARIRFRGPPRGVPRLRRHLWRMGLALLIATSSLFQGQPGVFPEALQGTFWLAVPTLPALVAIPYWLLRAPRV